MWFEILYSGNKKPVPQQKEDITEIRWIDPSEMELILKNTYGSIRDVLNYAGAASDLSVSHPWPAWPQTILSQNSPKETEPANRSVCHRDR